MCELKKDYEDDKVLRHSFNALAGQTFGLDFEDWYENGYWRENYIPYSMVQDGKVVANVSVNLTEMLWNGVPKKLIQLGTVMTDGMFRNRGLIRRLMEEIEKDYKGKADGMYLFANDGVLDFYPKFGFRKAAEYQYTRTVKQEETPTIDRIPMQGKEQWDALEAAISANGSQEAFDMIHNNGLYMFYVTKFMQENVYYDAKNDAYVIAEPEDGTLLLHGVFAPKQVKLEEIIRAFGNTVQEVVLGFVPKEREGYSVRELSEEDTTLFVKGEFFDGFELEKLMFPTLAHA